MLLYRSFSYYFFLYKVLFYKKIFYKHLLLLYKNTIDFFPICFCFVSIDIVKFFNKFYIIFYIIFYILVLLNSLGKCSYDLEILSCIYSFQICRILRYLLNYSLYLCNRIIQPNPLSFDLLVYPFPIINTQRRAILFTSIT